MTTAKPSRVERPPGTAQVFAGVTTDPARVQEISETDPVVNCLSFATIILYLKREYGDISYLLDRHEHSEEFLSDPNNWLTWGSGRRLLELAAELMGDPDPRRFYEIALQMPILRSVGVLEQLIRLFPSPRTAFARVHDLNRRANRILDVQVSNLTKDSAVVRIVFRPDLRPAYIYIQCPWHQGVLAAIPTLWDLPPAVIAETHCLFTIEEIVNDAYGYLNVDLRRVGDEYLVSGEQVARRSSGAWGQKSSAFVATRDLVVGANRLLQEGAVYGAPYCRYLVTWENKGFFENLRELTIGRLRAYADSRQALQRQLEYTEAQFFQIQNLSEDLRAYADDLEELVEERTAQLVEAEKLAAVGQLSFGVGHDLRNTLATAINSGIPLRRLMADLQQVMGMLEEEKPPEEIAEYMSRRRIHLRLGNAPDLYETMMNSLTQALENVNALEGYAVQDGSDFQEVRIEEVIERVLDDHRDDLSRIQVKTSFAAREYIFRGNPLKIYDIFQNLVLNAIEAMEETANPVLRIVTEVREGVHHAVVEDNGCGMSEEVRKHAFEPFYTTRELADGRQRGLGLFNVWRLVEQHAGAIQVESDPGQGSSFYVSFNITP